MTGQSLLVDGNNLLARAEFANQSSRTQMSVGNVQTGALVLFINMLAKYARQTKATHMAVYWDAGYDFRTDLYPAYKAARREKKSNFDANARRLAEEFLTAAGIAHFRHPGLEADDLIAMATRTTAVDGHVILSSDKDLTQLVQEPSTIDILQIRPPSDVLWGPEEVLAKFEVYPAHLPHYLALVGDAVDGVPGLRGVGPVKAIKMLSAVDWDWDRLLDTLSEETAEQAQIMLGLVDLRNTDYGLDSARFAPAQIEPPGPALVEFCREWELSAVAHAINAGTLWSDPDGGTPAPVDNTDQIDWTPTPETAPS